MASPTTLAEASSNGGDSVEMPNVCRKTSRRPRTEGVEEAFLWRNVAPSAVSFDIQGVVPRMVVGSV